VLEQVPQGDLFSIREKMRQPVADAVPETELSLLDELEDDRCHERLRDAADAETFFWAHRPSLLPIRKAGGGDGGSLLAANEHNRSRRTRRDKPVDERLRVRRSVCSTGRREGLGEGEQAGREREREKGPQNKNSWTDFRQR
jgi:hypothetical protein